MARYDAHQYEITRIQAQFLVERWPSGRWRGGLESIDAHFAEFAFSA
jgi:hypothetical protein